MQDRNGIRGYEDIIDLPHHVSEKYPQMPTADRAAQFAPFAALTGHDAAIRETARLTDERRELDEEEKAVLDEKLRGLLDNEGEPPAATFTYFIPDKTKKGGEYVSVSGRIHKVDRFRGRLILQDGTEIPVDDIRQIDYS